MAEHTPKPWNERGGIIYSPGARGVICQLSEPYATDYVEHWPISLGSPARDEIAANAALIIMAPNLLALVEAVEWVHLSGTGGMECPWCKGLYPDHKSDCSRQRTLARAQGQEQK